MYTEDKEQIAYHTLMGKIIDTHKLVVSQQSKIDSKEYKSYGAALGLQELRFKLRDLRAKLPKLRLV
jgi:hypothetical protein